VDEGQPALFRVRRAHRTVFAKVLADGAWRDPNGGLQLQLIGDAFLTPGRILCSHLSDKSRQVLGFRGLPGDLDFQRQNRRNLLRCQRMNVSGLTFTRASRHANRRPRITIISRVESLARCGFTFHSWNRTSCLRRKRFSAASALRDRETSTRRRKRSQATTDSVLSQQ